VVVVAGLGGLFVLLLGFWAAKISRSWGGGYWGFDFAAGVAMAVIVLFWRRRRLGAGIAGLVLAGGAVLVAWSAGLPSEPGPAMALGLAVLMASAVWTLPVRQAGALVAGGLAVAVAAGLRGGPGDHVPVVVLAGCCWLAGVGAGLVPRLLAVRRQAMVDRVRRDERLELARELHDVVAHHVTGIVVQAQGAQIVARRHPERLDGSLAGIEAAGSEALAAMRRVVGLLRDTGDAAPATPGPERLDELVRRFEGRGRAVRLRLPHGDEDGWAPEVTSTVYRVVQESLTNISRHAPDARTVTVDVARGADGVTVEVTDDAPRGAGVRHRGGYGLVGMRERVEALGGELRAGPRPGGGWSVLATLPERERG
jgi:signal transduction histidine kinase